MRTILVAALVLALVAVPAMAMIPPESQFELDGVTYAYIAGVPGSETMTHGSAPDGGQGLPYKACGFIMLHPGTPNGRVVLKGLYANMTTFDIFLESFILPGVLTPQGNVTYGYKQDEAETIDGRDVMADLSIFGNVTMRYNGLAYYDPTSSTYDYLAPNPDAAAYDRDLDRMLGELYLVHDGVRENLTGELLRQAEADDLELHVQIRSSTNNPPTPLTMSFTSQTSLPTEAYGAYHPFNNLRFGGNATLDISTTAVDPLETTQLRFTVYDPLFNEVANVTLTPDLVNGASDQIRFPLDHLGVYAIAVNGTSSLASYTLNLVLDPPAPLDVHIWWEDVVFGKDAYDVYHDCNNLLRGINKVDAVQSVVGRPDPPPFMLKLVLIGVAGGVTAVLVAVKLLSDQFSAAAFRKSK